MVFELGADLSSRIESHQFFDSQLQCYPHYFGYLNLASLGVNVFKV